MKLLSAYVHTHSAYDIRGRSLFRIIEGIIIGLFNIKNMGMEVVEQIYTHTSTAITKDWKDVWKTGVNSIRIEFLTKVYNIISEGLFQYDSELRWVLRTHLCNFVVDKGYRDEADSGFIIKRFLDEEGIKMLKELEHNRDDFMDFDNTIPPDNNIVKDEEAKGYNSGGEKENFSASNIRDQWTNKLQE